MFDLRIFVKKGLMDAIGKQGDYWVRLNAAGWHEKGVLNEADMLEIDAVIEAKNATGEGANISEEGGALGGA